MQEQTIGSLVRTKREALKLSQSELAEKSGITQATISRLEGGDECNAKIGTLRAVAKSLGCLLIDLLPTKDKKRVKNG